MFIKNQEEEVLLSLNLQFFAEGGEQDQGGQGSEADSQQGGDGSQQKDISIPKSRFDEVNSKYKELQKQLESFTEKQKQDEAARQQAELDAKKKNGEFEKLYTDASTELEGFKTQYTEASSRVQQLEGVIQSLVEAELTNVPEEFKDLIPEQMTPEQKLSWIGNAKAKGLFGAANNKQGEPIGQSMNGGQQQQTDMSKMSVSQLFRAAYGSKK